MKKQIFTLLLILSVAIISAQCTPDGSTAQGIRPSSSSVPCVIKGVPFSQTYSGGAPSNFIFGGQPFQVNSFTLDSIGNLPTGLSASFSSGPYAPGQPFCFLVSGTTQAPCGQYFIKVYVTFNIGISLGSELSGPFGYEKPYLRVVAITDPCPSVDTSQTSAYVAYGSCGLPDPVISTTAATNILGGAATLNGSVNAMGNNTTVSFEWGLTTAYGQSGAATPSSLNTSVVTPVSKAVSGLITDTVYHYRVKVTYPGGGLLYGNDQQFFNAAFPSPVVSTDVATDIANSSAKLNGAVNANGNTVNINFEWGTNTSYGHTNAATPPTLNTSVSTPVNTFLFGLTNNTTYHYRTKVSYLSFILYGSDQQFTTGITGIEKIDAFTLKIYPNPAKLELTIETETRESGMIVLTNPLGETVKTVQITGAGAKKIDISAIPQGIYTITLVSGGRTQSEQVIILNDK